MVQELIFDCIYGFWVDVSRLKLGGRGDFGWYFDVGRVWIDLGVI